VNRKPGTTSILALLAVPSVAHADVGTPLMLAGTFHLLFGNLLIGLLEGAAIAWIFRLPTKRCAGLLILANYLSAWFGRMAIAGGMSSALPWGLHNAWSLFWLTAMVTYVSTLALEFPFVAFAFRDDASWWRKAVRASLTVQTASYLLLFGCYSLVSGTSLYMRTSVVQVSAMALPQGVLLYFISADDGDVYAGTVRHQRWRKVVDLDSTHGNDRLLVRRSSQDADSWDIVARLEIDGQDPHLVPIHERCTAVAAPSWRSTDMDPPRNDGTSLNFGPVPKLGDAQSSSWDFKTGFWPIEGLRGTESKSGRRESLSLETPFVTWSVRNATHIPGDKVVFQLGGDQVCVYDPNRDQIALLAHGRGPVVVGEDVEPEGAGDDEG